MVETEAAKKSESSAFAGVSKLREVLPLYSEALWLLKELFEVPIDLERFIPEYCQRLPPGYLNQLQDRINALNRRLVDCRVVNDKISSVLKSEINSHTLHRTIVLGKWPLQNLYSWIQANFPPGTQQPARDHMKVSLFLLIQRLID